jgi:ubiquinone/menaquinone biosynthesis C-methylase UbiE
MASAAWHIFGRQLALPRGMAGRLTGYLMRHLNRMPYRFAIDALDVQADSHVLELGFGPGEGLAALSNLARQGSVHGIDASATMLAQAQARNAAAVAAGSMTLRQGDFAELSYPDHAFDRVLAVNVAYFWHDPAAVLREIRRILAPGGRLSVYVTDRDTMQNWPFAASETHRLFDAELLQQAMIAGGFATIEIRRIRLPRGVKGLVCVAVRA